MNAKIKEIYQEAAHHAFKQGVITEPNGPAKLQTLITGTFARLLIEECARVAENHARAYSDGEAGVGCHAAAAAVRCVWTGVENGKIC